MPAGRTRPGQRTGGSNWRRVRTPGRTLEASLLSRYQLRVHGWCIGAFMMAFMWAVSHTQMVLGVESLAVRYLATLGAGYVAYLLVLRLWAARLVRLPARNARNRGEEDVDASSGVDVLDVADALYDAGDLAARAVRSAGGRSPTLPQSGGGDFAGAGADGHFGDALGDMAGNALGAAAEADEGAVVVVPVVAIFLIGAAVLFGAGRSRCCTSASTCCWPWRWSWRSPMPRRALPWAWSARAGSRPPCASPGSPCWARCCAPWCSGPRSTASCPRRGRCRRRCACSRAATAEPVLRDGRGLRTRPRISMQPQSRSAGTAGLA